MADEIKFGTPAAKDATARLERMAIEELTSMFAKASEWGPEEVNRPPGTVMISADDQVADYSLIRDDPELAGQKVDEMIVQFGIAEGERRAVEWFEQQEKHIKEKVNGME